MTGPSAVPRTTPSASTSSSWDGVDAVALVQRSAGAVLHLRGGDLVAGQHGGLGDHVGAGVARRRREHGDQPRRLGSWEVVAVDLQPARRRRLGGRIGPAASHDHGEGDGSRHDDGGDEDPRHGQERSGAGIAQDPTRPWVPGSRGRDRSTNTPRRRAHDQLAVEGRRVHERDRDQATGGERHGGQRRDRRRPGARHDGLDGDDGLDVVDVVDDECVLDGFARPDGQRPRGGHGGVLRTRQPAEQHRRRRRCRRWSW